MQTSSHLSNRSLLHRYVEKNSQEAFDALVARHLNMVYATCRREVADAELAEDVTQAVFLLLARKAPALHSETHLAGWLFQTARFAAKNARAREHRRRAYEEQAAQQTAAEQAARADALWDRVEPFLNDALARLSAADREALLLRYWDGDSLAETGAALGVSAEAARKRVARAMEKLRRHLSKQGALLPGAALGALLPVHAAKAAPAALAPTIGQLTVGALARHVSTSLLGSPAYQLSEGVLRAMKIARMKVAVVFATVPLIGLAAYTAVRVDAESVARHAADLDKPVSADASDVSTGNPPDAFLTAALAGKVRYADGRPAAGMQVYAQIQNAALMTEFNALQKQTDATGGTLRVTKEWQEKSGNYALSRPDGTYTLPVGADIPYNIMIIDHTGLWVAVAAEGIASRKAAAAAVPDLVLTKGAIVEGVVQNGLGLPIPGAGVMSYGPHRPESGAAVISSRAGLTGFYRLRVAPGRSRVYTEGLAGVFKSEYVSVAAGETRTVDLKTP